MLQAAPHLLGFLLPLVIVLGVRLGGAWTFAPLALLLGVVPLVGTLASLDLANPGADKDLAENPVFRAITWAWVVAQFALLWWALGVVAIRDLTPIELLGLTVSTGATTGAVGITFAHELVHRSDAFERGLGEILLAPTSYTHFCIEHVYGHHRHVGTPVDPATARYGEALYAFVPRSVVGGIGSAWHFESARLTKHGRGTWHLSNRMLRYGATLPGARPSRDRAAAARGLRHDARPRAGAAALAACHGPESDRVAEGVLGEPDTGLTPL